MRAALGNADYRSGEREFQTLRFSSDFEKKMPFKESDVRKMIAKVEATSWHLRECTRVRELAATYGLERMRRLRTLEKQKAWK